MIQSRQVKRWREREQEGESASGVCECWWSNRANKTKIECTKVSKISREKGGHCRNEKTRNKSTGEFTSERLPIAIQLSEVLRMVRL